MNLAQHTKLMKAEYGKQLVANFMAQYELHGKLGAKKKTPVNQFRYDGSDSDRVGFADPDCSDVDELEALHGCAGARREILRNLSRLDEQEGYDALQERQLKAHGRAERATAADDDAGPPCRWHGRVGDQVDDGIQSRGSHGYQSSVAAYGEEAVEQSRRQGGGRKHHEPSIVARSKQRALYLLRKKQNASYNFSSAHGFVPAATGKLLYACSANPKKSDRNSREPSARSAWNKGTDRTAASSLG